MAPSRSLDVAQGAARRSYTQMEADIARKLGEKLYLFVCPENFPYDQAPAESKELQSLQEAYRAEIAKSEFLRTPVTDREELGRKVRELQFELEKLKSKMGRTDGASQCPSLSYLLLGGIAIGILAVAGRGQQEVYDRGRVREHLVANIETEAQKEIAGAGDVWRKTIEIEKWRDQRLLQRQPPSGSHPANINAGEATESYRKATDLLPQQRALMKHWHFVKRAAISANRGDAG